ncbi:MAG TPA: hypothetical protein VGB37_14425 [Candidatus Lokiarchaeia archaeon]
MIKEGFFSRLKTKNSIDSLEEFEKELKKLSEKISAEILALIGTGGRLKGLPLIYFAKEEEDLKKVSANLVELLNPLNRVSDNRTFRDITINFDDDSIFFKPILKNVGFLAIFYKKDDVVLLKQLIYKNEQLLKELFHDES